MKKIIAAGAIALLPFTALADNDVGCGLGTQVWEGKSGLFAKVLAATTNGTSGNQTFGITSGTLGCGPKDGTVTAANALPAFAAANMDQLAVDMSRGTGETLDMMAELYGMTDADSQAFKSMAQQNFASIFSTEATTSAQMLSAVNGMLSQDATLAAYAI